MKLITISISHFVEKVRWALERSRIPYVQECHVPGFHAFATLWATRGAHRATPVLVDGDRVVADSTAILNYLAEQYGATWLFPNQASRDWEARFDDQVGPHTRRYAYYNLFNVESGVESVFDQLAPALERAFLPIYGPILKRMMIADMDIRSGPAERSRQAFEACLADVSAALADGRKYLCGDELSAADIGFAALSAPLLLPENYGAKLPALQQIPRDNAIVAKILEYRATPAGTFALRLFREDRRNYPKAPEVDN